MAFCSSRLMQSLNKLTKKLSCPEISGPGRNTKSGGAPVLHRQGAADMKTSRATAAVP